MDGTEQLLVAHILINNWLKFNLRNTGQPFHVANNLFKRNFKAQEPRQKLVADITYFPFGNKMMYLSSIQDLYNGEIIAYSIGDKKDISFVLDTLEQVKNITPGCILHSD